MKTPVISIIIPTYNEEKVIEKLILSIKKQTYKNLEYIIVDNKSLDRTVNIAREYTKNIYIRGPQRSAQRNFGAKMAKGEYLLFLDADMELTPSVLEECLEAVKKKNIGAVAIPEKSVATNYWEEVKAFERSFYNESGDQTTDAARFFPKKVFEQVGGYDELITGPEDWDLPESIKKQGYKIGRVKSKILHHERIPNLFSLVKKKYYYALKSHTYLKKQKIAIFSSKTIYFLRPVFYKNWKKLISHPFLSVAMFVMFSFELMGGGFGFIIGKYSKK